MSEQKPNCYKCQYQGGVPGSSHTRCTHPAVDAAPPLTEAMAILASVGRGGPVVDANAAQQLNIAGHPHGIRSGWFNWPFNFDPVWLTRCDGFSPQENEIAL